MKTYITKEQAVEQLNRRMEKAKEMLADQDRVERFLQKVEQKLNKIPVVGEQLSMVPVMISLVSRYIKKEYTEVPTGTIIAIIAALLYFISPFDLISDAIPVIGMIDDIAVVNTCYKLVKSDLDDYITWRIENGYQL